MTPKDVPPGPLLIDTDVLSWIAWERSRHSEFEPLIQGHILAVSFATVGELWAGAEKAGWGEPRRRKLNEILGRYVVVPATEGVARQWGLLYAKFRDQVEENDMWTAACALSQEKPLPIVTGNLRHFQTLATAFALTLVHPDL